MNRPHLLVIDPAMRIAELECFNLIAQMSSLPCTYHLPSMFGVQSLESEDMASARGIIVLGSAASVHDRAPWQFALEAWLKPHLEAGMPTLGFCYGHQMLAHMLGGKVDYVFPDQRKHVGMRDVQVEQTPWFTAGHGRLVVSHCEMVSVAPPSTRVLAKSPEIAIDGLAHTKLPIWSFQSHPESTASFLASHDIHVSDVAAELSYGHRIVRGFLDYVAKNDR